MSQVQGDIDLSALSRRPEAVEPPRRSRLRILLPLLILGTFGVVLGSTLLDELRPSVEVRVVRPEQVDAAAAGVPEGRPVVQAAGWVEPDPFPIHASTLAAGVVREVLVQESDAVEAGQPVALLVDEDARLGAMRARAARDQAAATVATREAELGIARERMEAGLEVREAAAVAAAELEQDRAIQAKQAAAVVEGQARLELAREELLVQQDLAARGASGLRQVELAEAAVREAEGRLAAQEAEVLRARREVEKAEARSERAGRDLELRFEDRLRLESAEPAVALARAQLEAAEVALAEAELFLERMVVRAPVAGVVLERLTTPGMVLDATGPSHAVCSLYDPASLRVRVDVPQAEVEQLFVGQRAEILTQARGHAAYRGEVLRIVQRADIQKVTLEVQVRVEDEDAWIRPDMLAQVRFLSAGGGASGGSAAGAGMRVRVPSGLVADGSVWLLDPARGTARRQRVEVEQEAGGWAVVSEGLDLSSKVLDPGGAPLEEGASVRVVQGGVR
jgi:HlyD family secretion protein